MHVDVVPARECARHGLVDRRVSVLDATKRFVGEHHAEPEGVVGRVALPHDDLVHGIELFRERRKIQAARTAADHSDAHAAAMGW